MQLHTTEKKYTEPISCEAHLSYYIRGLLYVKKREYKLQTLYA